MSIYLFVLFIIAAISITIFYNLRNVQARRDSKRREKLAERQAELLDRLHTGEFHNQNETDHED